MTHGTNTGYNHHGCRCEACTEAHRGVCADIRHTKQAQAKARKRAEVVVMTKAAPRGELTPMADLDLAISLGWGDTPWSKLPADWKTRAKTERRRA